MKKAVQADIGLVLVAVIWGSGYIATRWALDGQLTPFYLLAARFLIAFFILALICHKKLLTISRSAYAAGFIIALFLFIAFALQTLGLLYTTVPKNAFITSVNVVIVPFLYWAISKKRPDIFSFSACFITLAGVALLSLQSFSHINYGDLLTLGCAFMFACQIIATDYYTRHHDPVTLTLLQLGFAGLFSLIAALVLESPPVNIGPKTALATFYLGAFSTLICYLLQTICQKYTSSTKTAIILSTEALFGTFFAILLLDEALTLRIAAGAILIFIAVITAETKFSFLPIKLKKRKNVKAMMPSDSS
ncbi:MAG: DMT family transporter [Endozoicomonas sp. (ex Botrylloides leachii)]|nr:DMT family transporter [Endozoicomonas sp. (ex Botrylloides leachii)]